MEVLAVDVGGTRTKWGLFKNEKLVESGAQPTPPDPRELMELMASLPRADSLAVAFAGFLHQGAIAFCPNMPRFQGFALKHELEEVLGLPVVVANDADCFTLGEAVFGSGKDAETVLGITLGTGVGSGIVVNKRIFRGAGFAGEMGHISVDPNGPGCNCGRKGCLEAFIGEKHFAARFGYASAKQAYQARDESAWNFYGEKLGAALADAVNLIDPGLVVIGGGVSAAFDLFEKAMLKQLETGVVAYESRGIRVVRSSLGSAAGLYGGFALVSQNGN